MLKVNLNLLMKKRGIILIFIGVIALALLSIYFPNYIQYRKAISLLRNGQVKTVAQGHPFRRLNFVLKDGTLISIKNLPFAPYGNLREEIRKCGDVCKDVDFWIE